MKVLWLANIPSPYRVSFFNELGRYCELTVLFERKSSTERDDSWKKYSTDFFRAIYLPGKSLGVAEAFCPSVIKYLSDEYDRIVITTFSDLTGILAIQWLKIRKIPYCLESDGAFPGTGLGLKEKIKKWIISGADLYFSTAAINDEYYRLYGAQSDRIVRYPFSSLHKADIQKQVISKKEKGVLRTLLGMTEQHIVLAVGQFIPRKGYDVLIKASRNVHNAGIYIVGGDAPEEYNILKKELKAENVHFIPFQQPEELRKYYMAADVFVHPTREDIWGLVITEAMACGLPVVTTDRCVAGLELVQNGINGYIIPTGDSIELANKINKAMHLDWNVDVIVNYTVEQMAKVHLDIWNKM